MSARNSFMDGTIIAKTDGLGTGGFNYYGFVRVDGTFVIQRESTSDPAEYKYFLGTGDFETAWTARASINYRTVQEVSNSLPLKSW